ncbi:MAG: phytoene/squalene synthase family protein [Eubacteriales bacterium]|nr:phytoene/squalene synthase family protein [Eubacteriales bacterium]
MTLQADLAWCESIIRTHSGSFYRAFKQLPKARAQAVFAIYAFCRTADDCIDVDHDANALARLELQLEQLANGNPPDEPLWRALSWAFSTFDLAIEPFREMIKGQRQDLDFLQPQTREDLDNYCYLVAGTVGLMILPLLARSISSDTRQAAIELGQAMQMTNILRDIGADYRMGRIYLPMHDMAERGILPETLGDFLPTVKLKQYWLQLARETLMRYAKLRANLRLFDSEARLPVILAILYYRQITVIGSKRLEHILQTRVIVPNLTKLWLLIISRVQVWQMNHHDLMHLGG